MLIDLLPKLTKLLAEITDKSMQDLWKPVTHTSHGCDSDCESKPRGHDSKPQQHEP